jgi:hypothetical protein
MATEKLDIGLSVKVVDESKANTNEQTLSKRSFVQRHSAPLIYALCLFIVLITATRIPYIGSYTDAYVFDFLFGYAKFVIYLYLIVFLSLKLSKIQFAKKMYSKRFLGALGLTIVAIILILSVPYVILNGRPANFVDQINTYMNLFDGFARTHDYHHFAPFFPSGGIFSQVIIGI